MRIIALAGALALAVLALPAIPAPAQAAPTPLQIRQMIAGGAIVVTGAYLVNGQRNRDRADKARTNDQIQYLLSRDRSQPSAGAAVYPQAAALGPTYYMKQVICGAVDTAGRCTDLRVIEIPVAAQ